jgi:hypothetical protein
MYVDRVLVETVLDRLVPDQAQAHVIALQVWTAGEHQGTIFWVLLAHGAVALQWVASRPAHAAHCHHHLWAHLNMVARHHGQKGYCIKECL